MSRGNRRSVRSADVSVCRFVSVYRGRVPRVFEVIKHKDLVREVGHWIQIGWVGLEDEKPIAEPLLNIYTDPSKYPMGE